MRGVALLLCWVVASCAPDYGHSAFRCDDEHGCPSGQRCIAGRCRRSDPIGDGSGNGVTCGGAQCERTQQCCIDGANPARCIDAGAVCPGTSALCDGEEDCAMDDLCCAEGDTLTCGEGCKDHACREALDCPSTEPNCCGATAQHWGECSRLGC